MCEKLTDAEEALLTERELSIYLRAVSLCHMEHARGPFGGWYDGFALTYNVSCVTRPDAVRYKLVTWLYGLDDYDSLGEKIQPFLNDGWRLHKRHTAVYAPPCDRIEYAQALIKETSDER